MSRGLRIVCAPDSFKGSVSAAEAAAAMARGAQSVFADAQTVQLPFADGGEGTLDAMLAVWERPAQTVDTVDALRRPGAARYGLSPDGRTALIEAAEANGLPAVSDRALQPLDADTYGVGLIAREALETGAEEILLCIGGSATTDAGTGLLSALGVAFLNSSGESVNPGGGGLAKISRIDTSGLHPRAEAVRWRIAVDVENPLTGPHGAAAVFGPQKGADAEQIDELDAGLTHLAAVLAEHTGSEAQALETAAGYGAAGGMPLTLVSLLGAEVVPGSAMVAEAVGLDNALAEADLVITGEGRLDTQSLGGKVVQAVSSRTPQGVPLIVVAGAVQLTPAQCREAGITAALSIAHGAASLETLSAEAQGLIEHTTAHACALVCSSLR